MNATTIVTIPAIAAIVYSLIDIVKTICGGDEKFKRFITLISAVLGAVIGILRSWCHRDREHSWCLLSAVQAVCP